ncbi:hypothetical protein FOZ62_030682 [Perkinsus olseni]|uniref:Nucleoside phosphorylase domain-containing protein n=1 Tax=Perkinsus olseni TaxID=32597 RepID=A0A7J6SII5_PEROL|nr:hypothetical protein FOZ62_030682 [Perkinsus olseni]
MTCAYFSWPGTTVAARVTLPHTKCPTGPSCGPWLMSSSATSKPPASGQARLSAIAFVEDHINCSKVDPALMNWKITAQVCASRDVFVSLLRIIALASVGSIRPDLFRIGDIAIPTDFIDFAYQRGTMTFWGNSDVGPFSGEKGRIHYTPCDHDDLLWRKKVAATLFPFKEGSHTVCLRDVSDTEPEIVYAQANGPRFESRAEVRMLQGHGHLVGMTCASEWTLAGELGVPYAIVAMVDNLGNGLDSGIDGNFMTEYQKHRNEHFHTTAAILDQIGRKARELLF